MEARTYGVHSYNIFSAEVSGLSVLFASKTVDPETYFMDPESKEIRKLSKEQYLVFNSDVLTFATTEFPVQFEFNSEREIEGFNFFVCNDLTADRKLVRFQRNDAESMIQCEQVTLAVWDIRTPDPAPSSKFEPAPEPVPAPIEPRSDAPTNTVPLTPGADSSDNNAVSDSPSKGDAAS